MKNFKIITCSLLAILFCSNLKSFAQPQPDPLCGPKSLLVICQKLGIETTMEELTRLSDYKEKQGTSMYGLYRAAQQKGLYAVGMKIGIDDLAKLKVPAIAHLWDNHFVVVEATGTDTIIVTDLPKEPRYISKDEFQNIYSGFTLLISKDKNLFPRIETKGADIRFDKHIINVGVIEEGKQIEKIFSFRNAGKTNLEILNVRATCGCTPTDVIEKNIKPEGKGQIKITFDTAGRSGLQNHKIYVQTNDPITPIVQLQIQGMIKSDLIIAPRSIVFGDIKKGTIPTREIRIIDRTGENIEITRVELYPSFLNATLSPITDKLYQGTKILVSISPETPLCSMEGKITIYTTDKKHSKVEISVTANIIGDIEFRPSMFFFGFVKKGETPTTQTTIFTTGTNPLEIERVESDISWISTNLDTVQEGRECTLSATLSNYAQTGSIKGSVTVYTK